MGTAQLNRYMILNDLKDHAYAIIKEFEEDGGAKFTESEINQSMAFLEATLEDFFLTENEIDAKDAFTILAAFLRCLTSMSGVLALQFIINTRLMNMLKKKDEDK